MEEKQQIQLSQHFSLQEFTKSSVANAHGIANIPNVEQLKNIKYMAFQLEHVRYLLGNNPILISSGFRSQALNKAIKGSASSSHCDGLAVDFTCPKYGTVKEVCMRLKNSPLKFDQIIYEQGKTVWCHLGFGERMRQEVLSWRSTKGYVYGVVDL